MPITPLFRNAMTAVCRLSLGCIDFPGLGMLRVSCIRGISRNEIGETKIQPVESLESFFLRGQVSSFQCNLEKIFLCKEGAKFVHRVILYWRLITCFFITREPLPTMFSMLHPLDEITPLVCKSGSKCIFRHSFTQLFFGIWG